MIGSVAQWKTLQMGSDSVPGDNSWPMLWILLPLTLSQSIISTEAVPCALLIDKRLVLRQRNAVSVSKGRRCIEAWNSKGDPAGRRPHSPKASLQSKYADPTTNFLSLSVRQEAVLISRNI